MTNIRRYSYSANEALAVNSWTEWSTIKSNMSFSLILSSERAHSFRRPFKNALKRTNSVSSSIDLAPNFCCETQVVAVNFSETKLGKEAKHKARISSKPLRKRGNQRVDDRQEVTDPIGFSEWKFIWCVEFF